MWAAKREPTKRCMMKPVLSERAATQGPTILSLFLQVLVRVSILPIRGGWQPKLPFLLLPALISGFPLTGLAHDAEVRDGCPSTAEDSVHPDGLTSILEDPVHRDGCQISSELSECRDGFPRSGDTEYSDTVFLRDFHTDKNSERVRQSDSGVQIVPASRSPSELSAHQMGLPLAGTVRLKSEPIGVDPPGTLDIGESVQLSISDRALLRKYKTSEQVRENVQRAGTHISRRILRVFRGLTGVRFTKAPQLEKMRRLQNEIVGSSFLRTYSGRRTRQWGS